MRIAMTVPMPLRQPLKGLYDPVVGILLASGLHLAGLWFMACSHNEIIHLIMMENTFTLGYDPWGNEEGFGG